MYNYDKFLTLCIDLEEFELPDEFGFPIAQSEKLRISIEGTKLFCALLDEYKAKATFFITENIARASGELVEFLVKQGHEIALHIVTKDNWLQAQKELIEQKLAVEKISGKKIYGCRTHKLIYIPSSMLKIAGLTYDNSLHPTSVPGRYCNIFKTRKIYVDDGIIKVPISVTPFFRLPFSWVWFRNLGYYYARFCSQQVYSVQNYINIYFHSWDFADIDNQPLRLLYKPLVRGAGAKIIIKLASYLNWCKLQRVSTVTMVNYLKEQTPYLTAK